jgi:hypothetical protein
LTAFDLFAAERLLRFAAFLARGDDPASAPGATRCELPR